MVEVQTMVVRLWYVPFYSFFVTVRLQFIQKLFNKICGMGLMH